MMPNLGGMNPRKMNAMMKQMGIDSNQIPANKVIIESDSQKIIIENPQVTEITVSGQKTYQIMGDIQTTQKEPEIPKEDIDMVSKSANVSNEVAKQLLEESKGDIAKAISKAQK